MERYDASTVDIFVFTFKEGLLSAMAHDLKLKVTAFTLDYDKVTAHLQVDANSLRVVAAMKDGQEQPAGLPASAPSDIERNVVKDVLEAKKYPTIEFTSSKVTEQDVVGQLTLHGQTHEVRGQRSKDGVEFRIDQRQFGIKSYSAMLGTLKVKPEVKISLSLRTAGRGPG